MEYLSGFDLTEFYEECGTDLEEAALRKKSENQQALNDWLMALGQIAGNCFHKVEDIVTEYLPQNGEVQILGQRALLDAMTEGALEGKHWGDTLILGDGDTVACSIVWPYQRLMQVVAKTYAPEQPWKEVIRKIGAGKRLFVEEGMLMDFDCGTFWKALIRGMARQENGPDLPGDLIEVLDAAETCYDIFTGEQHPERREERLKLLGQHWMLLRGA